MKGWWLVPMASVIDPALVAPFPALTSPLFPQQRRNIVGLGFGRRESALRMLGMVTTAHIYN